MLPAYDNGRKTNRRRVLDRRQRMRKPQHVELSRRRIRGLKARRGKRRTDSRGQKDSREHERSKVEGGRIT